MAKSRAQLQTAVKRLLQDVRQAYKASIIGHDMGVDGAVLVSFLASADADLRQALNFVPAEPVIVEPLQSNTADLATDDVFARYKKTAPVEDIRFLLRGNLGTVLRARAEDALAGKPTSKDAAVLRTAWREERQRFETENGIPAVGSPAWRDAQQSEEAA